MDVTMKKVVITIAAILFAIALAASLTGCDDKNVLEPAPSQSAPDSPTPSPSPSPVVTPSPSQQPPPPPAPETPNVGLLELGEYYFLNGDPESASCVFLENGIIRDNLGEEGEYEIVDDMINVYFEGQLVLQFWIIDEYTLIDVEDGSDFIREGGAGYGGYGYLSDELPPVFFMEYYYLNADADELGFFFWEDGEVDINAPDMSMTAVYTHVGLYISIIVDDEEIVFKILNYAELEDLSTGEIYAIKGTYEKELVVNEYYYFFVFGHQSGSIWFWDDGAVDIEDENGEIIRAQYTVADDDAVLVEYEGLEVVFRVINGYVLELEDLVQFVRIP